MSCGSPLPDVLRECSRVLYYEREVSAAPLSLCQTIFLHHFRNVRNTNTKRGTPKKCFARRRFLTLDDSPISQAASESRNAAGAYGARDNVNQAEAAFRTSTSCPDHTSRPRSASRANGALSAGSGSLTCSLQRRHDETVCHMLCLCLFLLLQKQKGSLDSRLTVKPNFF